MSVEHVCGEAKSSRGAGARRDTHLNAGEVESTGSGWFLRSVFYTIRRWYRAGLALLRFVVLFVGEVECLMGPYMLFEALMGVYDEGGLL